MATPRTPIRPRRGARTSDRTIYFWTDRRERFYATLRDRAGHWDVEWGRRAPAGSDHYAQRGDHRTSVRQDAVSALLEHVREFCDDQTEVEQLERQLRAALETP